MGSQHLMTGALAALAYAQVNGAHTPLDALALAGAAVVTATVPDVCNRGWWRFIDKVTPDEALGHGGPMQHRGITHFWGLLFVLAAVVLPTGDPRVWASYLRVCDAPWLAACTAIMLLAAAGRRSRLARLMGAGAVLAVTAAWLVALHPDGLYQHAAVGALIGWWSHLAGDWAFGRAGYGRTEGIPLLPWWLHGGLGGDVDGTLERYAARPVLALALAAAAVYVVLLGGHLPEGLLQ